MRSGVSGAEPEMNPPNHAEQNSGSGRQTRGNLVPSQKNLTENSKLWQRRVLARDVCRNQDAERCAGTARLRRPPPGAIRTVFGISMSTSRVDTLSPRSMRTLTRLESIST